MRGASSFKSTAVRLAIIYSSVFVLSYLGANVIAYKVVVGYLNDRLDAAVMERFREIEATFRSRGLTGAADMVNSHGPAIRGQETIYALRNAAGQVVAGNVDVADVQPGFSDLHPIDGQGAAAAGYKVFRGSLDDNTLLVGISEGDTDHLAGIVMISFGWTSAIVFGLSLGGAAVLRYRAGKRIVVLAETAHAIGHGELSRRLPVSPRMDEIDALSSEVNVALGRLESSVGALKQVTTDIAHDLKTPIGRAFLLLDDALHSDNLVELKEAVSTALQELSWITSTFDALLRIAQIESRTRTAQFTRADLCEIVSDIHEIYDVIAAEERHELELLTDLRACWMTCDPDLVRQMLVNLLANAMRHTPAGTRITIELSCPHEQIVLSVRDNGPGIPELERERVLERFYRLEKSRTTAGSGLGLSMVKAICDLHDARIELSDNNPGLRVNVVFNLFS